MPSSLKHFVRKPAKFVTKRTSRKFKSSDWKGTGFYYHRGKGKVQKFKQSRDLHISHETRLKGIKPKWKHIHDDRVVRFKGHKIGKI